MGKFNDIVKYPTWVCTAPREIYNIISMLNQLNLKLEVFRFICTKTKNKIIQNKKKMQKKEKMLKIGTKKVKFRA